MIADSDVAALSTAFEAAVAYIESLPHRRVDATREASAISDAAGRTLPDEGLAPAAAVRSLIDMFESGTVATGSPRFFGWVVGAAYPAAVAADWITSAWDQLAGPALASPAADAAETVVARWLTELLGLPDEAAVGFVTGGQMANFTALAAARHQQLARHGWDVEQRGLFAAPPLTVVTSHERHNSIDAAARYLGFGIDALRLVDGDDEGRIDPQALKAVLRRLQGRPVVVVLNAGTVNTGGFDEFTRCICEAHRVDAWVHVDGAFGLWAAAEGSTRHLVEGCEDADSWTVDGHKWLNLPYDNGAVIVRHRQPLTAAMTAAAPYLGGEPGLDPMSRTPELGRRARGLVWYTAMLHLGRAGIAAAVARACSHARLFAELLADVPGVTVLNRVELNQVLIRIEKADASSVAAQMRSNGVAFLTTSRWRGLDVIRISVSGYRTSEDDVRRTVQAIAEACRR